MPSFFVDYLLPTGRKIPYEALHMQENRGKIMSNTNNTNNTNTNVTADKVWSLEEAQQAVQNIFENGEAWAVSSLEATTYQNTDVVSPQRQLVLVALSELRAKFGPTMQFIHGQTEKDLKDFYKAVETFVEAGEMEWHNDVDSDILSWETDRDEVTFQIFKGQVRRTSQLEVEPKERVTYRNVWQETMERVDFHLSVKAEKMPILRPAFIAGQKMETGVRVVRRHSSVQLSTEFGGFVIRELQAIGQTFKRSMNMLTEFMALEERLEIPEAEKELLLQRGATLLSYSNNAMEQIRAFKRGIEPRAKEMLGERNLTNDAQFKLDRATGNYTFQELKEKHCLRIGHDVWNNQMTTSGKRNAALRKAMTMAEKDRLAILNQDMNTELASVMHEWTKDIENGLVKMATLMYVQQYSIEKSGLEGLSVFWNAFEQGLVLALKMMGEEGELPVYVPSSKPIYFLFEPMLGNMALVPTAHAELTARGILNQDIEIVTVNDEVGIQLECGFFPLQKRADRMKWLPAGRSYVAKVTAYNNTVKAGLSLQLSDIRAVEEPPVFTEEDIKENVVDAPVEEQDVWDGFDASDEGFVFPAEEADALFDTASEDVEEAAPQPVVLATTPVIDATLKTYSPEQLLTQEFEMKVSPLGTQVYIVLGGQHHLAFTTDVELSSLDGMRHDGTNFVI